MLRVAENTMGQGGAPAALQQKVGSEGVTRALGRILVIEDDPAVQKALRRLFEAEGYLVGVHANGVSALESFQKTVPTAVILDLRSPKMSGRDVCRQIKAVAPNLPIVVLSAASDVADKVLLLENLAVSEPQLTTAVGSSKKVIDFPSLMIDFSLLRVGQ